MSVMPVEMHLSAASFVHAIQLEQEIGVEEGAAKLPVGHALEAKVFLHVDNIGDGGIFHLTQGIAVDRASLERRARIQQGLGAQEAADVIGSKGGTTHLKLSVFCY
jgi:hypothetical protein